MRLLVEARADAERRPAGSGRDAEAMANLRALAALVVADRGRRCSHGPGKVFTNSTIIAPNEVSHP